MTEQTPKHPPVPPLPSEPIVPVAKPEGQRVSLEQAMVLAERLRTAGRLEQAENTLRQVLRARPRHAPALHLLGVVVHQRGQTELAIEFVSQAIEIDGRQPLYHSNRGEMCRIAGRLDEAIRAGERAVALDANAPSAWSNLGIAYYDKGDLDKAERCQKRAIKLNPRLVNALNNLGSIRRQQKDRDGAIDYYRQVLAINPDYPEANNNLGAVLLEEEHFEEAMKALQNAIRLRPRYADAYCNLGLALSGLEQMDPALQAFQQAVALRPAYVEAHIGIARILQEKGNLAEAFKAASTALKLAPAKAEVHCVLGGLHTEMGYPDRAEAAYAEALRLDGNMVRAHLGKGSLLMELGRLDEAEACFRRALEIEPEVTAARVSLTQVKKATRDDANLEALEQAAESIGTMPRARATSLHFALGKCYDDIGEYDRAFEHFEAGGRLKRSTLTYDADAFDQLIDSLIAFFDRAALDQLRGGGDPSDVPVFVLGMARSGTTLTEQIIASHPAVHGAGELPDLIDLANRPGDGAPVTTFPHNMKQFTRVDFSMLGKRYVEGLRRRAPAARRITDKMPANYLCIGLMQLALPNARIVHVRRHPVDTCLSGFSRLFSKGQPHSYDLVELGRYYRGYARLMDHWRSVLPGDAMLEVQYEDLVSDHEAQARRLIAYCGLEWDDACLDFFKHDRSIRTASVIQVRQPIYKTSLDRWKRYERHLAPLIDVLGDLVPKAG